MVWFFRNPQGGFAHCRIAGADNHTEHPFFLRNRNPLCAEQTSHCAVLLTAAAQNLTKTLFRKKSIIPTASAGPQGVKHEVAHALSEDAHAGEDGLREHHAAGGGMRPRQQRAGGPCPGQSEARSGYSGGPSSGGTGTISMSTTSLVGYFLPVARKVTLICLMT